VWHFYVIGVIFGVAEAFFWPASSSILPSLVAADQLRRAFALVGASEQFGRLVGPILGGGLIAVAGTTTVILVNAGTFFIAALTLAMVPRSAASEGPIETSRAAVRREIGSGLSYVRSNVEMRVVLMLVSAATLTYGGVFGVGLPTLAKTFEQGSVALGVMLSAWGLGQLAGSVGAAITGLPHRWGLLIIGLALCEGAAFALVGILPNLWLVVALLALLGFGVAYSSDVALPLFVQSRTPTALLGRVNSIIDLPKVALEPISLAIMGVLVAINVRLGFVVASLPMLALGIRLGCSRTARELRTEAPS
jgi:hypothetical protein